MNNDMTQATTPATAPASQPEAQTGKAQVLAPAVDIVEDAEGITVHADMPGVPKDMLHVQVDGDTLTLRGEMKISLPQGTEPFYAELRHGAWERSFTLSRELDRNNIQASMKDGVLSLRIPKAEHAKPRKVEVRVD